MWSEVLDTVAALLVLLDTAWESWEVVLRRLA